MTRRTALVLWPLLLGAPAAQAPGPERGARLDVSEFTYQRALREGARGLVALPLDAAVLAHSKGPARRFADVRLVDDAGYQIPYVLVQRDEPLQTDLPIATASTEIPGLATATGVNRSVYAVVLPYENLPEPRLVLTTSDRVFRRRLRIGIERQPDREHREPWFDLLATTTWQHADPDVPATPLELAIAPRDSRRLLLAIDEGDNRPLVIAAVRLELPSWRVRFFRPDGPVTLVYGNESASVPQYDLALLAGEVSGADAPEVQASPEAAVSARTTELLPPWIFWSGLAVAALILLGVIVRLIRSGTPPPPSPPRP